MEATEGLVKPQDSTLIVIDVQAAFTRKLPPADAQGIAVRTGWLIGAAGWLDIPVLAGRPDHVIGVRLVRRLQSAWGRANHDEKWCEPIAVHRSLILGAG